MWPAHHLGARSFAEVETLFARGFYMRQVDYVGVVEKCAHEADCMNSGGLTGALRVVVNAVPFVPMVPLRSFTRAGKVGKYRSLQSLHC